MHFYLYWVFWQYGIRIYILLSPLQKKLLPNETKQKYLKEIYGDDELLDIFIMYIECLQTNLYLNTWIFKNGYINEIIKTKKTVCVNMLLQRFVPFVMKKRQQIKKHF